MAVTPFVIKEVIANPKPIPAQKPHNSYMSAKWTPYGYLRIGDEYAIANKPYIVTSLQDEAILTAKADGQYPIKINLPYSSFGGYYKETTLKP